MNQAGGYLKLVTEAKYLKYIFLLLILTDVGYTFLQNYYMMLPDGDMANIILPSDNYSKVLKDPFGFSVLFKNEVYAAPNRFFLHWFMSTYFKTVPFFFQIVLTPLKSVFLSMAIVRTLAQVLMIGFIAAYASGGWRVTNMKFIATALIVTPFFQASCVSGYERYMGVTDMGISYAFSYAVFLIFVLLYFFPFQKAWVHKRPVKFNVVQHVLWIAIAIIIAFGGPLGSPIILIICPGILALLFYFNFRKMKEVALLARVKTAITGIPFAILLHFTLATLFCLYSFYIGRNNEENLWVTVSIADRYKLLPQGLWNIMTNNLGVPLLFFSTLLNLILLSRVNEENAHRIFQSVKFLGLFCLIYLLLLPLGGYRSYRPFIIRYDTFAPVTLCLMFAYGSSAVYMVEHYKGFLKGVFVLFVAGIMSHYTLVDKIDWDVNKCNKDAFAYLQNSPDKIVFFDYWCNVMTWEKISDYHASELNCRLLKYWGILKGDKLYYERKN